MKINLLPKELYLSQISDRNELIVANIWVPRFVAYKYFKNIEGLQYGDLMQEGYLGLLRATEDFDESRGIKFSTYAAWWVRSKIERFIKRERSYYNPHTHDYTKDENVLNSMGRPTMRRSKMQLLDRKFKDVGGDDCSVSLIDVLDSGVDIERDLSCKELSEEFCEAIDESVSEFVQNSNGSAKVDKNKLMIIIERRLLQDEPYTLEEVGKEIGITREGVRINQMKLVKILKKKLTPISHKQDGHARL